MKFPRQLLYSKTHEWAYVKGDTAKIGLTDFAQNELGDLVFVNLPEIDDEAAFGERIADVESVKAVSDVYSPVSGIVTAVNEELLDSPELINESPYDAWIAEIGNVSDTAGLMSAEEYKDYCEKQKEA